MNIQKFTATYAERVEDLRTHVFPSHLSPESSENSVKEEVEGIVETKLKPAQAPLKQLRKAHTNSQIKAAITGPAEVFTRS